ncbi:MAG: alpha/beta fold hydrolase [Armatimonadetes bacterium]|nr:alpha/beta fold hydrolase [Armatimonadota bacterium]
MADGVETTRLGYLGGCLVRVERPAAAVGAAVIVPPFAEEKKAAHRAVVEAARALAGAGWDTAHLDLRGTGDSALDHAEVDLSHWLDDLRALVDWQRGRYPGLPLVLIGLRLGGALAYALAREVEVAQLVLWEPVVSGSSYLRQSRQRSQLRAELTDGSSGLKEADGAFDFDGFAIGPALSATLGELDLAVGEAPRAASGVILQISGTPRIKKPLADLGERMSAAGCPTTVENVAVEAFWSAIGLVDASPVVAATLAHLPSAGNSRPPAEVQLEASLALTDGLRAEVRSFASGDQQCHGVLYRPAGTASAAAVLLHGWSGYRVGPGQLLTRGARALAAAGVAAYSFDFRGRGDSEWQVGVASLNSMIRDAARAVPLVCEWVGVEDVLLLGLCSGGEVAIGASLSDPRVTRLVLWSAPIFSGNFDFARRARRSKKMLSDYWRKLFVGDTWAKLLSGRLNWKLILRAVGGGRSAEDAGVVDKAPETAQQMKAFEAFGGKLLFIYGGNDPETAPSREFYSEFVERVGLAHTFCEVAGANHNFYALGWHEQVIGDTLTWLREG